MFPARNYNLIYGFLQNGKFTGFNIAVEKHAQVPEFEKFELNIQGYGPVNVVQRID